MRSEAPALLPMFRSRHQADLLTVLFLQPAQDHTATELAARVGVPLTTAHRELQRLEDAELLVGRQVGRSRLLRANTEHRAFGPLAQLLLVSFGPQVVVAEEFAGIHRATSVIIYGSWAARYDGITGPPPGDVDVLVVGALDRGDVYAAAERAEARLGVSINPVVRSTARWHSGDDPLVQSIRTQPFLDVTDHQESTDDPSTDTVPA